MLEARSGRIAAAVFAHDDRIDLVLTDVVLPDGMSGAELAHALRARRPDLPVVFMSGYTENALREAMANEIFIAKPFAKADMARALRRAIGAAAAARKSDEGSGHGQ